MRATVPVRRTSRAASRVVLTLCLLVTSAIVAPASQASTPTIATDASPEAIAIDNTNDVAYVVESQRIFDQGPDSLGIYDATSRAELGRLLGRFGKPAIDETRGSAFLIMNNQVVEVDGESASIVHTYADSQHPTAQLTRVTVGDSPSRVYVVSQTRQNSSGGTRTTEFLSKIDPDTGVIETSVTIQPASTTAAVTFEVLVDPVTESLVLQKSGSRLDVRSLETLALTDSWTDPFIGSITIDPAFRRYVASGNSDGGAVAVRDLDADGALLAELPGRNYGHVTAVDGVLDRMFVTRIGNGEPPIAQLWEDGALLNEFSLPAVQPDAVAAHRSTGTWWLADGLGQTIYVLTGHEVSEPPASDTDGDGIDDRIDTGDGTFDDGAGTTGALVDSGGYEVHVAPAGGGGIRVEVIGNVAGSATLELCGYTVEVGLGGDLVMRCGSITVEVTSGTATLKLGSDSATVVVPAGGAVHVDQLADGSYKVENRGPTTLTLTVDGVSTSVAPGATVQANDWNFTGFGQPVDQAPTLNSAKAGSAIPLKWRVVDSSGAAVTNITEVGLRVGSIGCSSGTSVDAIEEYAAGGSGLQNLGNGYYQYNWKPPKTYAGTCRRLMVDIGDGVTHDALFSFTK